MVDTQLLEEAITQSGKSKTYLADKCGITIQSLRRKITNLSQFKTSEYEVLCSELTITKTADRNKIFFAKDVDKMTT